MKPIRIQRKRTKGWRMPPNTVNVTRPGKWGNRFIIGKSYTTVHETTFFVRDAREAVSLFRNSAIGWRDEIRRELSGKNLACWCAFDQPCHADVLLEIANA